MNPVVDWLNGHLKDLDHEIFKDVVKISDAEVKPMGDGQIVIISEINRATLTLETSTEEKRTIKLVAKFEPPPGAGREMANKFGAFATETMMYSDILKSMMKLMVEVGDTDFFWPECYHCSDNRFIFEDLCEIGFKIVPTYNLLDLNHALLVMKTLGKFHGLSMIMIEKGILDVNNLNEPVWAKRDPMFEHMQRSSIESLLRVMRSTWDPEWLPVADRLSEYFENSFDKFYDIWHSTKDKWGVLNHGDFTMRNMLFHYSSDQPLPDGIKFIDFQLCNYCNLGFDLSTILYTSLLPSVREDNMTQLLTAYTDSLTATCKQHDYEGPVPTLEDVEGAMKSLHYLSTILALFQLPFFVAAGKQDAQQRATDYIETTMSAEAPEKQMSSELFDYSDKDVEAILKSELQRCIKQNIF